MTKDIKKPPRIGSRQFWWLYSARDAEYGMFNFYKGGCHTAVPPVLLNLVKKGWMWAEMLKIRRLGPKKEGWLVDATTEYRCGLTDAGRQVLEDIRLWNHQQYERRKAARDAQKEAT